MVSRRCTASKSTVCTNHGAAMPSAAANNWLVITPSARRLVNPSSQDGRAAASTVVVVSLWICGRQAHTAQKGLPAPRRPQLHRLNNNNNNNNNNKAVYQ
jgi:hypothetical protein